MITRDHADYKQASPTPSVAHKGHPAGARGRGSSATYLCPPGSLCVFTVGGIEVGEAGWDAVGIRAHEEALVDRQCFVKASHSLTPAHTH
jgi:hypothetical protein